MEKKEGGPRFWRERLREIRSLDSVCAGDAGCATSSAKTACAVGATNASLCAVAMAAGQ